MPLLSVGIEHQEKQFSGVFEVTGCDFSVRPVAPEYIRPSGATDGAAGVLVQHKAVVVAPGGDLAVAGDLRLPGFGKNQSPPRENPVIQRQ